MYLVTNLYCEHCILYFVASGLKFSETDNVLFRNSIPQRNFVYRCVKNPTVVLFEENFKKPIFKIFENCQKPSILIVHP